MFANFGRIQSLQDLKDAIPAMQVLILSSLLLARLELSDTKVYGP